MCRSSYLSSLSLAVCLLAPCAPASGGAPCCAGCGCQPCTKKVCRLVCETKEVSKKVYSCKCEDFCIPGKSICCKNPCAPGGLCRLCCDPYIYKPTCGCVRTRVVPVITEEKKKVPAYKCVVEEVCTRCGHCAKRLDYPVSEDPAAALAMVKDQDVERVVDAGLAATPSLEVTPAAATSEVASRSFVDRLFLRK